MKFPRPDSDDRAYFMAVLPRDPLVSVKPMFGNEAAFVNGNMFAGLFGRELFIRLSEDDQEELLREKGASRFAPMKGRPMRGYICVPDEWRGNQKQTSAWVARSLAWTSALPPKTPKTPKRPNL